MRVLGIDDSHTVCDKCGKKDLKCTVVLDYDGDVVKYGRDCAGEALTGRKNAKATKNAELLARAVDYAERQFKAGKSFADVRGRLLASAWANAEQRGEKVRIYNDAGSAEIAAPDTSGRKGMSWL